MTALEKWAREVYGKASAKPGALRKALFQTSSGIELPPLHSPDDPPPSLGFPGQYATGDRPPATVITLEGPSMERYFLSIVYACESTCCVSA